MIVHHIESYTNCTQLFPMLHNDIAIAKQFLNGELKC